MIESFLTDKRAKALFTREDVGSVVNINRPTNVITQAMKTRRNGICIIYSGTNDNPTTETAKNTIAKIRSMVDYENYIDKKYIVLGLHINNTINKDIDTVNMMFLREFGVHFINVKEYMVKYGLVDANIAPTEIDNEYINNGNVPPSLMSDNIHWTGEANKIIAKLIYEKGVELGYWF